VVCDALEGRWYCGRDFAFRPAVPRNLRRVAGFERTYGTIGRINASKGEPQRWDRDETSLAGYWGEQGVERLRKPEDAT
jgi:hypothetical protein